MTSGSYTSNNPTSSSTLDPPQGVPLYLTRDGEDYHVRDVIGVRYGHGRTLIEAMTMWAEDVEWVCVQPDGTIGGTLLVEQKAYREALKR